MRKMIETRLAEIGLHLPEAPVPKGNYVGVTIHNGVAYLSGQVSRVGDDVIKGPVDHRTPPAVFRYAAETCVLRALSTLVAVEDAYAFERVLFMRGTVNAVPGFAAHSNVLDGASDLLHAIFGDRGRHSRSAIGAASLPSDGLLEIELVVALASLADRTSGRSLPQIS